MKKIKGACIILQSGGPTAVINASTYGAIRTALDSPEITGVYVAANGIRGLLEDRLYDMSVEDPKELHFLLHTPSSIFGSCRYKMADYKVDPKDYLRILEVFKKHDIRYFFYNGGNGSMDACNHINEFMKFAGYECRVIGIPKTIDNDIAITDHCPGYPSAAKYVATTMMELYHDARVYDIGMITIVEIMGRNCGWLTAAASLASYMGSGPDLIYVPEVSFCMDMFLRDVAQVYHSNKKVIVAVSEGIRDKDGKYIYEREVSSLHEFEDIQLGGTALVLADVVRRKIGVKVRAIEFSLLQRCAAHLASGNDVSEAFSVGKEAVLAALAGRSGVMIGFKRTEQPDYAVKLIDIPLDQVAFSEKKLPKEWINKDGNGINGAFIDYALPLIQGELDDTKEFALPRYAKLKKKYVEL